MVEVSALMKAQWLRFIVLAFLGLLLSCGAEDGPPSTGDEEEEGPYVVAISADHLDIYGGITVSVEGHEPFLLDESGGFSCEDSPLLIDRVDFELDALSEKFFYWGQGSRKRLGGCIEVRLDVDSLDTGVGLLFRADFREEACLPVEYLVKVDGREFSVGTIARSWKYEHYEEGEALAAVYRRWFDLVREQKALVFGGGMKQMPLELRAIEPEHCKLGEKGWIDSGMTPPKGETKAWGVEVVSGPPGPA